MLPYYGTVGGRRVAQQTDLYEVENVLEKPTPSIAEQKLVVPGLRAGHYLCYFGIHVFTPAVLEMLGYEVSRSADAQVQLSPVLARLAARERYLALDVKGTRFNIGVKYGLLNAQLALALDGADRENVLAQLVELLAHSMRGGR
jgi:UTP--glucose-1-phosphate uridylyltransferase